MKSGVNFWDEIASIRRDQIESGLDITFNKVFVPYFKDLVKRLEAKTVIDLGCGTGHLLLSLAEDLETAMGIDASNAMIEIAKEVLKDKKISVYRSRVEDFKTPYVFDLVLSHLCLQTLVDIDGFLDSAKMLIRPHGYFAFSIPHPCFWNFYQEYIPNSQFNYMSKTTVKALLSVRAQPIGLVPYTHRSLTEYSRQLADAGLFIVLLEEIYPPPRIEALYGEKWEIPRFVVLVCKAINCS
jgi:2-polyprenyl-3-methyl-5-hydroxy-6-metoxy-1,4-benzoquinol methylase